MRNIRDNLSALNQSDKFAVVPFLKLFGLGLGVVLTLSFVAAGIAVALEEEAADNDENQLSSDIAAGSVQALTTLSWLGLAAYQPKQAKLEESDEQLKLKGVNSKKDSSYVMSQNDVSTLYRTRNYATF